MTFSKRVFTGALILFLSVGVVLSAASQTSFKIATVSPDGSAWMRDLRRTTSLIEAQTEGRVSFRVYPGGVMGDDRAVLRKMRARQLQGGIVQTGVLEPISSAVQLYNLPMFFRDFEEVTKVRSTMDSILLQDLADHGFEALGFVGVGFANAMSSKSGTSINDARRLKVWAPKGDAGAVRLLDAFGIVPVPLSIVDVLAGLQTGLIDTVAVPPTAAIVLQWHTQLDYILDLPFMYIYSVFVLDARQFARLEPSDQELTRKTFRTFLSRVEQQNYADHDRALAALERQGLTVLTPSEEEIAVWRSAAERAAAAWVASDILVNDHVNMLEETVATYRESTAR
ncbi:MAG: TRAP transporter substrate-binding protein DctP [Gammaproteobacteria bacterium]|nr:TRAP transporter substrate-binding protein DctP [Gammaproteobacteria bacterium]